MPRAIPSKDTTGRKKRERRQAAVEPQPEDTYSYGTLVPYCLAVNNLMLLSVAASSTDTYGSVLPSVAAQQNETEEEETEGELLTGLFLATSTPSTTKSKNKKPNAPAPKPTETKNGMIQLNYAKMLLIFVLHSREAHCHLSKGYCSWR